MKKITRGFTLVELLVVIGIIALLIAILMPALARARDSANTIACQSNQRQLAMLVIMYATENQGWLPYGSECTDGSGASSPTGTCSAGHRYRAHTTFYDWSVARSAIKTRICPGSTGRHWNAVTKKLAPGSWWGGSAGDEAEQVNWIMVSSRLSPRDDHSQQNAGIAATSPWRAITKISKFRPSSKIMATVDGFNYTKNVAGIGAAPDENADNLGDFGYGPERLRFRHGKNNTKINLSFLDGHAETWEYETVREQPTAWGAVDSYERCLLSGDSRFFPWGYERTK